MNNVKTLNLKELQTIAGAGSQSGENCSTCQINGTQCPSSCGYCPPFSTLPHCRFRRS